MRYLIIKTILLLTFSHVIFGQKTMITGTIDCFGKEKDCCLNCPSIWVVEDSVSVSPDKNGQFKLETDKKNGNFSIKLNTIGSLTLLITDVPYSDLIKFQNIDLIYAKIISPRQYKRIEHKLKKKIKSKVELRKYLEDNYAFIQPIGGKSFYFDLSGLPPDKMRNPVDNSKLVDIIKANDKTIRLKYTDLIKKE